MTDKIGLPFETERLKIQMLLGPVIRPQHIEWLNDKNLMRWSEQRYKEHTEETQKDFLYRAIIWGNPRIFDITLREDVPLPINLQFKGGDYIGAIHADVDAQRHMRADLSIMLGPPFHGQGYAAEAWRAVEEHLRQAWGISKFEAGCVDANKPMIRLLENLSYEFEGQRVDHFVIDGENYDLDLYGKLIL